MERKPLRKAFQNTATGVAMLGALAVAGTSAVSVTSAVLSPAQAQTTITPVLAPAGAPMKKLSVAQCKFMADRAIEMVESFKPDHFSPEFKLSIGSFATHNFDCTGRPVFEIGKPEDDRGVLMIAKTMYDNKKGFLLDAVIVHDPKGIAPMSKVLKPERVVRTLPPEFASTSTGPGPRG